MDELGRGIALAQLVVNAVQMIGAVRQELTHRIVTQPFGKLFPSVQRALPAQLTPRIASPFHHFGHLGFGLEEFTET